MKINATFGTWTGTKIGVKILEIKSAEINAALN